MFVNFNILNQLGSPAINSNTFANRPAAGQTGRLFVSTDTYEIYRDNGTTWDLIGGPGSSTITGTGTANYITKFTGSQSIGNSIMTEGTGLITITGTDPRFVIGGTDDGSSQLQTYSNVNTRWKFQVSSDNATDDADITGYRTRGTVAAPTAILAGDSITNYSGRGYNGTAFSGGGGIDIFAEENFTAIAGGTYISFLTTSIGATSETEKIRLTANGFLGINTSTPGARLDVHSTGTIAQFNTTSATGNTYIAFQRTGTGLWRIGDTYNGGSNFFELHNTVLGTDALEFEAATNKSTFVAQQIYTTGLARGNYFDYNLSVAAGGSFSSPNAITALTATLDLTLAGNATIPSGARSGLDAYNSISFNGAGTLTLTQGTQIRAYSNLTTGWAFNGNTGIGTVTHLAGLRVLFPDNTGNAINITNNYALLLNDQTANTGTVIYTNRWGIYQEGASDLNYFAANTLIGSNTNSGERLQVTGKSYFNHSAADVIRIARSGGTNANTTIEFQNSTTANYIGSNGTLFGLGGTTGTITAQPFIVVPSNGEKMRLDANGNLGLRVTPSAWSTSFYNAIEGGDSNSQGAIAFNLSGTSSGVDLWSNGFFDGTNSIYKYNGTAGLYQVAGNVHRWYNAPSGTAGNAISFTQAMTLNASGNFLIGTTTDAGQKLQVNGNGYFTNSLTSATAFLLNAHYFYNGGGTNDIFASTTGNGAGSGNFAIVNTVVGAAVGVLGSISGFFKVGTNGQTTTTADRLQVDLSNGNTQVGGYIKTAAPTTGTSGNWKLGSRVAATVVVNTTEYIEVDIGGTLYKLATVT